jgi:hypothetical protein
MVMHVEVPITAGHVLKGTAVVESKGRKLTVGTNVSIMLEPDTRVEAIRRFGVPRMVHCAERASA